MDRLGGIPNVFYDLIVFATPAVLLVAGLTVGLSGVDSLTEADWSVSTSTFFLILGAIVFLGYEYGRAAEAWSAYLVQRPLLAIRKRTRLFSSADFCGSLEAEVAGLGLVQGTRAGDKWTMYFFAFQVNPVLGADLLKRYAWEKLARSSALSLLLLSLAGGVWLLLMGVGLATERHGGFGFGSYEFLVALVPLTLASYIEYYRRNCWNTDLLKKVYPVLVEASRRAAAGDRDVAN
jgi:hypothetical protein